MSVAAAQAGSTPDSPRRLRMMRDEEWSLIEPLLPPAAGTGRPRKWSLRAVFEAVLYLLVAGCQWRLLPPGFPPRSTVHRHFIAWRDKGLIDRINHLLVTLDREREGREASPSAAIVDSKSVRTSVTGGTKGYDAGKKVRGMKWHVLVDTSGRLLLATVTPADMHDGRAGVALLRASRPLWPFVERLFADRGYAGRAMAEATCVAVTVVTGPTNQRGFIVQKRRWVVERTFAWIEACRRLRADYERHAATAVAFITLAAAMVLARRLARS